MDFKNVIEQYKNRKSRLIKLKNSDVVYSMGRCGSTWLERKIDAYHLHSLFTSGIHMQKKKILEEKPHQKAWHYLEKLAIRNSGKRIYVPFRDPTKRIISIFFQMLPINMQSFLQSNEGKKYIRSTKLSGNELITKAIHFSGQNNFPDLWVERELFQLSQLDWSDLKSSNVKNGDMLNSISIFGNEIVIFRIEDIALLSKKYPEYFPKPSESDELNNSRKKWYYPIYKEFIESDECLKISNLAKESKVYEFFYKI